jgi:ABC-type amino acid transport substrate-binding protein
VGLVVLAWPAVALRVCFLEEDLPRAQRATASGFDYEVMAEVAAALNSPFEPVWSPSRPGFSEIEESDLPLERLARGECDAVASVPGEDVLGDLAGVLTLSRPYYGAGFELVGTVGPVSELAELRGRSVGARLQSLAHVALVRVGADWLTAPSDADVLELLRTEDAEAALVWGPSLGMTGPRPVAGWTPPRALRWNEHVAIRDVLLLAWVEEVVRRLSESGELERLADKYGIPFHAPFETVSDTEALHDLGRSGQQ